MNEVETAPVASERRIVSRMEEFRRSILLAPILAIGGSGLYALLHGLCWINSDNVAILLWTLFAAGEAWIQFRSALARAGWMIAGFVTGEMIVHFVAGGTRETWEFGYFAIPAAIESISSWRSRRNAWVWLVVTPLIYAPMNAWAWSLTRLVRYVMSIVHGTFGLPTSALDEFAAFSSMIGLILITRAVVRSFIASRKDIPVD